MAGWSDAEVLAVLWDRQARGLTFAQIALARGASRSAVLGVAHRAETALSDAEIAALPDALWLAILDAVDRQGRAADVVAKEFAPRVQGHLGAGLTRYGVLQLVHRARIEAARVPDVATRAENRGAAA